FHSRVKTGDHAYHKADYYRYNNPVPGNDKRTSQDEGKQVAHHNAHKYSQGPSQLADENCFDKKLERNGIAGSTYGFPYTDFTGTFGNRNQHYIQQPDKGTQQGDNGNSNGTH